MTTKDEALKQALEALVAVEQTDTPYLSTVLGAIEACSEALAQKDEQEPVAWMLECPTMTGDTGWILSWSRIGAGLCNRLQGEEHEKPLYTAPPKRQPLTDAQRYALIEKHLGLEQRKNATVIDHRTGRWTDAARYFDLMDAAIAKATGEQT